MTLVGDAGIVDGIVTIATIDGIADDLPTHRVQNAGCRRGACHRRLRPEDISAVAALEEVVTVAPNKGVSPPASPRSVSLRHRRRGDRPRLRLKRIVAITAEQLIVA
jgi:hypothetical protein